MRNPGYPPFAPGMQHVFLLGHAHAGHPLLRVIFFVILLALLASVIFLALKLIFGRSRSGSLSSAPSTDDALATLRLRYARGEVARDEFLQAHADLGGATLAG